MVLDGGDDAALADQRLDDLRRLLGGEGLASHPHPAAGEVRVAGRSFRALEPSKIISALAGEGGIVPAIQHHGTTVFEKLTA